MTIEHKDGSVFFDKDEVSFIKYYSFFAGTENKHMLDIGFKNTPMLLCLEMSDRIVSLEIIKIFETSMGSNKGHKESEVEQFKSGVKYALELLEVKNKG